MAAPSGVIWDLLPHTATKHEILRLYLGAWFPILGIGTARIAEASDPTKVDPTSWTELRRS